MRSIGTRGARTLAALAVGSLAFGLVSAGSAALADPAPRGDDIVGVGSDTLQYMLDFGADGYGSSTGYNAGKLSRVYNFDATPDANARAGYLNGSISTSQKPLNPTIVLRSGKSPVQRPNGSGSGINALLKDVSAPNQINYVRSSSILSTQNVSDATAAGGVGNLHVVRLANDGLHMVAGDTTNAVPLSAQQLVNVYQCTTGFTHWNDSGIGGTSADTIIPILPQNGSGTRKTFLADIASKAGVASVTPGSCVKTYEENDPYALYVDSTGNQIANPYATTAAANPDAISPISDGRLKLYTASYFKNPNVAYGSSPAAGDQYDLNPTATSITTGTPSDSNPVYGLNRPLFVIFRDADLSSTAKFNGSTRNWAKTLFADPSGVTTPYFAGAAGQALLAKAGVTPSYSDCGVNVTDASTCP